MTNSKSQLFQRIFGFKKIKNNSGFTLVEMLTVIVLFVVIASIAMSILFASFRTAHKTDIVTLTQQNGNYAISQIAKTLRNARGLLSPFPCVPSVVANSITVITSDNQQVSYVCNALQPPTIASNGASLLDTNVVSLVGCSFTCSQASKSDLPVILVNFSLQQQTSSTFAEQLASISAVPFQTSVVIRNITR